MWKSPPLLPSAGALRPDGNHFDLLRLLLAIVVIYSHSYLAADGTTSTEPGSRWTSGRYTIGGLAVAAFIALSGFLVAESWHRSKSWRDFLLRRVRRIFPAYIVCYLVSVAVAVLWASGQFRHDSLTVSLAQVLLRAVLLSPGFSIDGAFPDNPHAGAINISLWTICVEFALYFLLLAVAASGLMPAEPTWRRMGPILALFASALLFRAFVLPTGQYHDHGLSQLFTWPPSWTGLAPYFVAGMVAWCLRFHLPRSWLLFALSVVGPAVLVRWPVWFDLFLPFALTYFLLFLGFLPGLRLRLPHAMGDLSYGVYLYGYLVQQVVVSVLPAPWINPYTIALVATPVALAVALLSWHGIEKHFLRRRIATASPPPSQPELQHLGITGTLRGVPPHVSVFLGGAPAARSRPVTDTSAKT